ncbi:MAG: hypothetical protein KatS3mg097_648 [Candidatus Parcubacteria bacterium]|nr:MAG: hypothetical protein KatS3mg097_648 [Candidatus Parcubacteria bacterium]
MNPENPNFIDKNSKWEEERNEVNKIVDRLGNPIDEGIKETVIALRIFGLETTGSCEGHLERGLPYPWVDIGTDPPEDWDPNIQDETQRKIEAEWKRKNFQQREKIIDLLNEFYRKRLEQGEFDYQSQLIISDIGIFGGFRFQSLGASTFELKVERLRSEAEEIAPEIQQEFERYRQEMQSFTQFLKKKFFEN